MTSRPVSGKILIVDDEAPIRKFLSISLSASGYDVVEAASGKSALEAVALNQPDLVILDLGLPDVNGQEVIGKLREWTRIPILVLSVRDDEAGKVRALDGGANDYVTKPFGIAELLARVRALTRLHKLESGQADPSTFSAGKLKIDYAARTVELAGEPVRLTRKEYDLLRLLTRNAGKVLTRNFLLREVWGPAQADSDQAQYLRVHIGNLRHKLKDDWARPAFIHTEPGVGYRFVT
jgi:two-component system, OmpR family, KDP operon response regulator KdpE